VRLRSIFIALISIWVFLLPAHSEAIHVKPGQYEKDLIHDGIRRTYIVHIPPHYDPQKAFPLVLLFHGGSGNAKQALDNYGLVEKANKEGFVLVAPNGTGILKNRLLTWNVGFGFGYAMSHNIDDIGFTRKLINELEENLRIDPQRIFATGISNGGILCHFLAAQMSDKIAAIAPVVATIGGKRTIDEEYILPSQPNEAVSVIAFNGLLDEHIPYSGGLQKKSIEKPVWVKSGQEMHAFWIKANHCTSIPHIEWNEHDEYKKITYDKGINDSEVIQYLIFNQGHAWPGGKMPRIRGADTPSKTVNATDLMWEFFKKHPKK
jgi:polyhydroxybutyrate depolymerase